MGIYKANSRNVHLVEEWLACVAPYLAWPSFPPGTVADPRPSSLASRSLRAQENPYVPDQPSYGGVAGSSAQAPAPVPVQAKAASRPAPALPDRK